MGISGMEENIGFLHNMFKYVSFFTGMYDEWAHDNDMDMTKMKILHGLYYKKCNKQCDIVKNYNLSRTTVSSSIKVMSSKQCGLVNVNLADKTLSLTPAGIEQAKKIEDFFKQIVLKVEKSYGADPKNVFKNFNVYANLINVHFTGGDTKK